MADYKLIPIAGGQFAMVDAQDFDRLSAFKWHMSHQYAVRTARGDGKRRTIYLHREAFGAAPGLKVDHINGNPMDCRKANLRPCTQAQNCRNAAKRAGTSSRYRGVSWHKGEGKFTARIHFDKRVIRLGSFASEVDAALAYNAAAVKYHGAFARLNEVAL